MSPFFQTLVSTIIGAIFGGSGVTFLTFLIQRHDNLVTIDTDHTLIKLVRGGGADIDNHMRTRKAICFNYLTGEKVGEIL